MRSPFFFIVTPVGQRRYDNTKEIGGVEFTVSSSEEDHKFSNRFAEVISTPLWYKGEIGKGDLLLVHHNVFKYYNDMRGRQKSGRSFFRDDVFMVDNDQFFMYKKNGKWKAHDRYCFVKPIAATESYIKKPFTEEPLMGEMMYPSEYLISKGVNQGDTICFTPDSEYEFNVDGEKLFRMYESAITMKLC